MELPGDCQLSFRKSLIVFVDEGLNELPKNRIGAKTCSKPITFLSFNLSSLRVRIRFIYRVRIKFSYGVKLRFGLVIGLRLGLVIGL